MSKKNISVTTRKCTEVTIVGQPLDISAYNVLPTKREVLKYFEFVRNELKFEGCHQPEKKVIAGRIAHKLEEIWKKASIPVSSTNNIVFMILKLYERCEKIKKSSGHSKKNIKSFKVAVDKFTSDIENSLFDICSCKCRDLDKCLCPTPKKVPKLEHPFLIDQRSSRAMIIGGIDQKETNKMEKRNKRKEKSMQSRSLALLPDLEHACISSNDCLDDSIIDDSSDESFAGSTITTRKKKENIGNPTVNVKQHLPVNLPSFSRACDRRAISNRAGAQLASALLQDLNIISPDNQAAVIDKSKIFRERLKNRQNISSTRTTELIALYFDGRKDETITKENISGKSVRKTIQEEHISLVEEPGSAYFGHVTPNSGSGKDIVSSILKYMRDNSIDSTTIKALGCDGTATNTGVLNGAVLLFERELKHPVQIVICMLHLNELPLRKVFVALDGPTTGPSSFSGPIGKRLVNCQNLPVIRYEKIDSIFPEVDSKDLSTDQKYLWDICQAVLKGECPAELANRNPGNISHARWLTMANRILRLYISTDGPTCQLKKLAEFVMKIYAVSWFSIKMHSRIIYASLHFFKIVQCSKLLDKELKAVVQSTLQRNAFMGHPEHILLGMLFDSREHVRVLASQRIEKARLIETSANRVFKPPQINFEAEDYIDLIDWQSTTLTIPPLIADFTKEEIDLIVQLGSSERKEFQIPLHTQAVERIVKEVTTASKHVCGAQERNGFIRSRLMDRKCLPKFETKRQYTTTSATTILQE